MALKDIKKALYKRGSNIESRKHEKSLFNPETDIKVSDDEFQDKNKWDKNKKGLSGYQKKSIIAGVATVSIFAIVAFALWAVQERARTAFNEKNVQIIIEGPERVDSAQLVKYKIKYENNNRVTLKNAEIFLNYTENFQLESGGVLQKGNSNNSRISLGDIKPHSSAEVEFSGRMYAPENYTLIIKATLRYIPSNFNSTFQKESFMNIDIKSSPIMLEVDAPLEITTGGNIEYLINYKNTSSRQFNDVRLEVEYPKGFIFKSADLKPAKSDNFWYLGDLEKEEEGSILIKGELYGSKNEGKVIKLSLKSTESGGNTLTYGEREKLTRVIASPLSIKQEVKGINNNSFDSDKTLEYVLTFKNEGKIGLREVIITCRIEGDVLDFSRINVSDTSFNDEKKLIVWKAVDNPKLENLQPGESGKVVFAVPIVEKIPIENDQDKNFIVTTIATIDSPDVPTPIGSNKVISTDKLELKLNTKVLLEATGYYDDQNIENFGPIPPQIGKETSYTMRWSIENTVNDASNVKLESSLPTGVMWKGKIYPENEKVTFNTRTHKIEWDIGTLKNGIGILGPKREVSFQVSIIPQINNLNTVVSLLNHSTLTAVDAFTSENMTLTKDGVTTSLLEFEKNGINGSKVVDVDN